MRAGRWYPFYLVREEDCVKLIVDQEIVFQEEIDFGVHPAYLQITNQLQYAIF